MSVATPSGSAPVLDQALAYHHAGLSTIPIRTDGTKAPAISAWRPYIDTLPTEDQVRQWFRGNDCGVAVIHGAVSGETEVVDLDQGDLLDPFVEALDHGCPGLYQKLCVIQTPRPGYHLIYKCEAVQGSQKLALRPPTEGEIAEAAAEGRKAGSVTLIETRGQGGYALAPGSPGACHTTGREYVHLEGPPLTALPTVTPAEREALFQAARSLDQMPVVDTPTPVARDRVQYEGESPGDAYARSTSWASVLEPHGWVHVGTSGERQLWRRPGKRDGWSATTGNVSKQGRELLCVFSSNAHPFAGPDGSRQCSTHGKFDAYARLNHGGDHSAAATELLRIGYGERKRVEYADRAMRDMDPSAAPGETPTPPRSIPKFTLGELRRGYPRMGEPVIDGLIREGETCNIIAASKVGKSWLGYGLALSVINNHPWLDRFDVSPGRVLLVDNELHRSTLANRIPAVANAMGIPLETIEDDLDIWPLRGDLRSLQELGTEFEKVEPGEYKLVILDAKYRFADPGSSENDNAAETAVYNLLDRFAAKMRAAFVLIHHASKGDQSGKAVTDVGAGAGAQSRATDCHLVIRPHEEDGCAVLDAAVRSFAPVQPVTLRWAFPVWIADAQLDPAKLLGRNGKADQERQQQDVRDKRTILDALGAEPAGLSVRSVRRSTGFGKSKAERLLDVLEAEEAVERFEGVVSHNASTMYRLAPEGGGTEGGTPVEPPPGSRTRGGVGSPLKEGANHPPSHRGTSGQTTLGPIPFPEFGEFAGS